MMNITHLAHLAQLT